MEVKELTWNDETIDNCTCTPGIKVAEKREKSTPRWEATVDTKGCPVHGGADA